jgi:hypothetical protein
MLRVLSVVDINLRVYPGRSPSIGVILVGSCVGLLLFAAGCGGGGSKQEAKGQTVTTSLYEFQAPADWKATVAGRNSIAKQSADTLASVTVLPTLKAYRPKLFPELVGELDRLTGELAGKLHGRVTGQQTTLVAGGRVRQYKITHGDLVDELTFVFRGKEEYLLTCRWHAKDGRPQACDRLTASFRFR